MATVYLAHDRRLERYVALKVMHPHLAEGTDVIARFRREARAAARLAHPGIVAVLDQGTDGDLSYLTMEYVRGRTLRTEIAGNGALSLGQSLAITEGVLDALAAAHRVGLVHRDIKPENVLVTPEGTVKVGDFGLARAVTEATAASTGTLLGTVAYLSPEIVASGQADARADVYAVGIMLFEMLSGHPPFEGDTPIQIAYRHVHEDVPAPSEAVPWLPVDVDDLVAELTARDVAQRPEDAAEALALVRRLRRSLDQRALSLRAQVEGRPELLIPVPDDVPVDANRHAATLPAGVTEEIDTDRTRALDRGPGTGTIALPIGAVAVPEAEQPAPPKPRKRRSRALIITLLLLLIAGGAGAGWWFLLGPGSRVVVPDVSGRDSAAATATLEELDLVVAPVEAYHDDVPTGSVIRTDPESGTSLPRGENVDLVVSLGIEHLVLDDLTEMTQEEAVAAIETAGFPEPEIVTANDRNIPAGSVVSSDPAPGSYPHDMVITLTVSDGPQIVTFETDYVGEEAEAASNALASSSPSRSRRSPCRRSSATTSRPVMSSRSRSAPPTPCRSPLSRARSSRRARTSRWWSPRAPISSRSPALWASTAPRQSRSSRALASTSRWRRRGVVSLAASSSRYQPLARWPSAAARSPSLSPDARHRVELGAQEG